MTISGGCRVLRKRYWNFTSFFPLLSRLSRMNFQDSSAHGGLLKGSCAMQQFAGALRRTLGKVEQFDQRAASVTMHHESPLSPGSLPLQGCHRFLAVRGQSPPSFDRLRDLSLLTDRDEAQAFPPLRRDTTYRLPTPPATQETEPELWHPRNPSTIAARGLPAVETFLGEDSLPRQLMSRLNPSDTRLLAGETEQLTEPFVRVEGTSERYSYFPASENLPLSGLWHDPVPFSDAGKGQTALKIEPKKTPNDTAESRRRLLPPDPSGLPMAVPKPLSLTEEQVTAAPRAAMQYAAGDISVYPRGVSMDSVVDLQEKALFKLFDELPRDSVVENLLLDAVRPGFKRGVIEQMQEPTESQWLKQREQEQKQKAEAKTAKDKVAWRLEKPPKAQKALPPSERKKVTFNLPDSPPAQSSSDANVMFDGQPEEMLKQLRQLQHLQKVREAHQPVKQEAELFNQTSDSAEETSVDAEGKKYVHDLITRCSLKLKALKDNRTPQPSEPAPTNSKVASKKMERPSRLLKNIEVMELRKCEEETKEAGDNLPSCKQESEGATVLLPQLTEKSISIACSKGLQALRSLRGRPRVRSPRSMARAELVSAPSTFLPRGSELDDDAFISEEEAAENICLKATEEIEQPSYEVYHGTPTPLEDIVDASPSLNELSHDFLPTTSYPHDGKTNSYPAAIPSWVSRLSRTQDSRVAVPPAAAVLYALPDSLGGPPVVEAMPTDLRSGAPLTIEAALSEMTLHDMRNIEELVSGGYAALRRQAHKVDYRHRWEDEKVRLKMIINEPIHARDPQFTERQERLLSKWKYPAKEISPGYYIREANLQEVRQSILASKKQCSIFDLQKALREMKKREEEEVLKRRKGEEHELQNRLRDTCERGDPPQPKIELPEPKDTVEPSSEPSESPKQPEEIPEPEEPVQSLDQLKETYRQLRKQPTTEETEREMKLLKHKIVELAGRKKKKSPIREVRRKAICPPPQEEMPLLKTEEQIREQQRRERIVKLLQAQQAGTGGAMLAKVMEGRGVEDRPEDEEQEPAEEEDGEQASVEGSSEESAFPTSDSFSSLSASSYDSIEVPTFQQSEYYALEHRIVSETVEEWLKLPVDYCGRLLMETKQRNTEQTRKFRTRGLTAMRGKSTGQQEESLSMFILVEARGPALLIYVPQELEPKKKRFSLVGLCRTREEAVEFPPESPKKWHYICSILLDNTGEVERVNMAGDGSGLSTTAIRIQARVVQGDSSASQGDPDTVQFTQEQLALREKTYLNAFLSADTDAETEEWLAILNGRKAFARYVAACEEAAQKPMDPVAASLWSPGPREVILHGVPFQKEIDNAIFTSINLPYLEGIYCGWRGLDAEGLRACLQGIPCVVRTLDLSANQFGSSVLKLVGDICHKLRIYQLSLAENQVAGGLDAAQGIATLMASPGPLLLDLRRIGMVDEDCSAIAEELKKVKQPGLVSKIVDVGENDISGEGLKTLAGAISEVLPGFRLLCLANIPALGPDKLPEIVKGLPLTRQAQISANYPIYHFRSLDEVDIPERCFTLPAVFSGRLFVENGSHSSETSQEAQAENPFLAFFELRGPALLRYAVPPRSSAALATKAKRFSGQPLGAVVQSFGKELSGIMVSSVMLSNSKLKVTGNKIISKDVVSRTDTETWIMYGESEDYVREWFRVLLIRRMGVECNTIARNAKEALHPGVGQYCSSCFRRTLDLGGRQLGLGQLARLFSAVSEDFRLKVVDMSDMGLENATVQRIPRASFSKSQLAVLDLSFNAIVPKKEVEDIVAFCGSAKECACLVLDGNPLGDNEAAALFVIKLLEHRIQRICLNYCGLGDEFATAVCRRVKSGPKVFPFVTTLELQSNAISEVAMKEMVSALLPRCPALTQFSLYGNGFETIGPFQRNVALKFTKTHLDAPNRRTPLVRRLTKKPKEQMQLKAEWDGHSDMLRDAAASAADKAHPTAE